MGAEFDPARLRAMLNEAGIEHTEVVAEAGSHPLNSPEDWRLIATGGGYRGTIAQLGGATLAWVRAKNLTVLDECETIATSLLYSVTVK